jgi:hypothetical protein
MNRFQLLLGLSVAMTASLFAQTSQAGPRISFGIGIGPGYFYGPRPYYGYGYGYRYGYGYPYYAPGPIVYEVAPPPPPIVIRQSTSSPPPAYETVPAPSAPSVPPAPYVAPVPSTIIPTQNVAPAPGRMGELLGRLNDPSEAVRRDSALDLGRLKVEQAVDPLMQMLAKDSSANARDAAARALGLIASPRSMKALIYAAQADDDREVRRSAQFAVEVIRSNLRGK